MNSGTPSPARSGAIEYAPSRHSKRKGLREIRRRDGPDGPRLLVSNQNQKAGRPQGSVSRAGERLHSGSRPREGRSFEVQKAIPEANSRRLDRVRQIQAHPRPGTARRFAEILPGQTKAASTGPVEFRLAFQTASPGLLG